MCPRFIFFLLYVHMLFSSTTAAPKPSNGEAEVTYEVKRGDDVAIIYFSNIITEQEPYYEPRPPVICSTSYTKGCTCTPHYDQPPGPHTRQNSSNFDSGLIKYHVIPRSKLISFFKLIFSNNLHHDLQDFWVSLEKFIEDEVLAKEINILASPTSEIAVVVKVINDPDQYNSLARFIVHMPFNIFEGPKTRSDDPGDSFEDNARYILPENHFNLLENINKDIDILLVSARSENELKEDAPLPGYWSETKHDIVKRIGKNLATATEREYNNFFGARFLEPQDWTLYQGMYKINDSN